MHTIITTFRPNKLLSRLWIVTNQQQGVTSQKTTIIKHSDFKRLCSLLFLKTLAGTQAWLNLKFKHRKLKKEQLLPLRFLKSRSFIPHISTVVTDLPNHEPSWQPCNTEFFHSQRPGWKTQLFITVGSQA